MGRSRTHKIVTTVVSGAYNQVASFDYVERGFEY